MSALGYVARNKCQNCISDLHKVRKNTLENCVTSLWVTHNFGPGRLPMFDIHLHHRSLCCCLPLPHCPAHPMIPFGPVWGTSPGSPAAGKQQRLISECYGRDWAHHWLPSLFWDWREELKKPVYVDSERCWCTSLTIKGYRPKKKNKKKRLTNVRWPWERHTSWLPSV